MMGHEPGDVSEALWLRGARLPLLASIAKGVESIVIVALGASLGREAAPQQIGAAWASTLSDWAKLPGWQRRLLVACGAGSGMAAVYNVPFGGALFALEVLLGTLTLPLVLPALATSLTATAVAWVALPHVPTYVAPPLRRARLTGRVGAARRADRRRGGRAVDPARRPRPLAAADERHRAVSRAGRRVRGARRARDPVSAAARQRETGRAGDVRRDARRGAAGGAAGAQAARHRRVSGLRRSRRPVHADARLRRAARRPARQGLDPDLAGGADRHLRGHRRSRGARRLDAGTAGGDRAGPRADTPRRRR